MVSVRSEVWPVSKSTSDYSVQERETQNIGGSALYNIGQDLNENTPSEH
jgi:hypothetical protein